MNGRLFTRLLLAVAIALSGGSLTAQEVTTGSITGTVYDNQGATLPGASVSVTSNEGAKSTTTDGNGSFRFLYLTPGNYQLKASMHGFTSVEQKNIGVRLGGRTRLEVTLTGGSSQTIEVTAAAAVVNLSSSTQGSNISDELMASVPIGRNFASTLSLTPGVVEGGIGGSNPSIGGASGLENTYVVDGVNINNTGYGSAGSYSIVFGSLGTGVTLDYIQEVQVKTGGYEPEFGEALGGFVNLVTKSGGNDIRGSAYTYLQPAGLEGERARQDDFVDSARVDTLEDDGYDFGLGLGGPLVKDRAFFFGAFNPQFTTATRQSGLAIRNAGTDVRLDRDREIWNYAGNVKLFPSTKHSFAVSTFGDPSKGDMGGQRNAAYLQNDSENAFSEIRYGGHNVIGSWNGEVANNWFVESSLAWHKDKFEEDVLNNFAAGTDRRTSPERIVGGVGFVGQTESKNLQWKVKASNFFEAGGEHNLRYGYEVQDINYDVTTGYTGPSGIQIGDFTTSTGYTWRTRSGTGPSKTDFEIRRTRAGDLTSQNTQTYQSFFVSDSWNIGSSFNLMAGVRYEQSKLKGTNPVNFVTAATVADPDAVRTADSVNWDGNWGPRLHASWDPTKDNKSKLYFGWGRFFGKIPLDLADRQISGETGLGARWDIADVDLTDPNHPVINGAPRSFSVTGGGGLIDSEAKISYQDEWVTGGEYEIMPFFKLGASYTYRKLGRTLEDVQTIPYSTFANGLLTGDGFFLDPYFITNPTTALGFPKPTRDYRGFTISADKRMHDRWQMFASYTWSKLEGNYEGYFRRDNGQSDPFITSLFDFPYLRDPQIFKDTIDKGVLPNDRTHVFIAYGSYMFKNDINLGLGLRVQTGNPITRLGFLEFYGNSELVLSPRGSEGRGDTTAPFDLHFDYPLNLGGSQRLQFIFDVFNVFNQQQGIDYYLGFEKDGSVTGLPGISSDPCPTCLDPDFGKITVYQAPREARFAFRWSFGQ